LSLCFVCSNHVAPQDDAVAKVVCRNLLLLWYLENNSHYDDDAKQ